MLAQDQVSSLQVWKFIKKFSLNAIIRNKITGWGNTQWQGQLAENLQYLHATTILNPDCASRFAGTTGNNVQDNMLCRMATVTGSGKCLLIKKLWLLHQSLNRYLPRRFRLGYIFGRKCRWFGIMGCWLRFRNSRCWCSCFIFPFLDPWLHGFSLCVKN